MSDIKLYLQGEKTKIFNNPKDFNTFLHHNNTITTIGERLTKVTIDDGIKEITLVLPEYQDKNGNKSYNANEKQGSHFEKFYVTEEGYNHQETVTPFLRMNIGLALNKLSKEHEKDLHNAATQKPNTP